VVAYHDHDQVLPVTDQRYPHVQTDPHFETAGLELAQSNPTMDMRAAKHCRQIPQLGQQISAGACQQNGDLCGGAAGLQNLHREIPL